MVIFSCFNGVSGRDGNVDTNKVPQESQAIDIGADFNVCTDGSAPGGLLDVGVVVTRVNQTSQEVVKTMRPRFTCSYEKERGPWRSRRVGCKRIYRKKPL